MTDPIVKSVTVPLAPGRAFALFTRQMLRWWPFESHSIAAGLGRKVVALEVGEAPGAPVVEVLDDGTRHPWGKVVDWQPGRRFAMTWHVGRDESEATRVAVDFEPSERGTRVTLTHSGWEILGDAAAAMRDNYHRGWDPVLARYQAAA